jgi:hypothetical protein
VTVRRGARWLGLSTVVLLAWEPAARAAGPDTNACIAAFDEGQRARIDRKLRHAQAELLVCTQESCPSVLRADCAGVLRSVQASLPTIVLAADDGEGHDLTDATVRVGDTVVASKLDGRALEFDPGTYDFRFERASQGGAPTVITVHQVLREGEKNRVVRATFGKKGIEVARTPGPTPRPLIGYVLPAALGVAGAAALGFALYNRLSFDSKVEDMRRPEPDGGCAPVCTQEQRADLSSTLVTSNVSLGIGIGVLLLAGVTWFAFAPRPAARPTTVGTWAW